jgi:PKD repeat protein
MIARQLTMCGTALLLLVSQEEVHSQQCAEVHGRAVYDWTSVNDISANIRTGPAPLTVTFTDLDRHTPSFAKDWLWGDGNESREPRYEADAGRQLGPLDTQRFANENCNDDVMQISHTYQEPGIYTVELKKHHQSQIANVVKPDCECFGMYKVFRA